MGGGLSAYDIVNAGEKLDLKALAVFNDAEEDGGEGCDIDQDDGDLGNTALTQAIKATTYYDNHRMKVVHDILRRGADVNQLSTLDETPLHTAAYMGRDDIMKVLLERNAQVNTTAQGGWTPLHMAALAGHPKCVELLLKVKGISVHGTVGAKYSGKTAQDLAFLRLTREQHENALSYVNDDWTHDEIINQTRFFRCFDLLDHFINDEKRQMEEAKRQRRRIRNPFEPIYDRKGRRKRYCINCDQGYWSRTHVRGRCPECRGSDEAERLKAWEEGKAARDEAERLQGLARVKERKEAARREKQRLLYAYPDRASEGGHFEVDVRRVWTSALKVLEASQPEDSLDKRYFGHLIGIGEEPIEVEPIALAPKEKSTEKTEAPPPPPADAPDAPDADAPTVVAAETSASSTVPAE